MPPRALMARASGRGEELGNDDRRRVDTAHLADEVGVGPLARARGTAEQDQFLGEAQSGAAELLLQIAPDGTEDELRILDLQIGGGGLGG